MSQTKDLATITLYNTLTRALEKLTPLTPGVVNLYCCGPTVYNFQHIGNLRTYIFEDVLARTLRFGGYKVRHAMNITDVGHLVSDADEGEDKMVIAARREKKSSLEIADYYTKIFFEHCQWLNIQRPDIVCKATEHISEMIGLIKRLEQRGVAYQSAGNVYFDVSKFPEYGKLARLDLKKLQAGARIDVDQNKRHPLDFALWFTKSKFENQELQWDSPWGRGYPGWHIECSAMSMKYLGEHFDIHCGGIDHIPVHHTNEIAQSQAATDKPLASVWLHGGFLLTENEKMSKSSGQFLTLDVLKERGIDPIVYRLFCLGGVYRNELVFSWEALENTKPILRKFKNAVLAWRAEAGEGEVRTTEDKRRGDLRAAFSAAVFHDLGVARALAVVHEVIGDTILPPAAKLTLLEEFDEVLGLGVASWKADSLQVPDAVGKLLAQREEARKKRDWKVSDELRGEILKHGFVVEDSPAGQVLKPKNN